jgi:hypothetical protein
MVFLSLSRQMFGEYLDQATTASFQILSNSIFTIHLPIRRYIILDTASYNKPQETQMKIHQYARCWPISFVTKWQKVNLVFEFQNAFVYFCSDRQILWAWITQSLQRWVTGWTAGIRFPAGIRDYFSSPQRPNRLWGAPRLLFNEYRRLFPRDKAAGAWSWPLNYI